MESDFAKHNKKLDISCHKNNFYGIFEKFVNGPTFSIGTKISNFCIFGLLGPIIGVPIKVYIYFDTYMKRNHKNYYGIFFLLTLVFYAPP